MKLETIMNKFDTTAYDSNSKLPHVHIFKKPANNSTFLTKPEDFKSKQQIEKKWHKSILFSIIVELIK